MPRERPSGATLRLDAWAKVNLTLHVLGRRADGYHELDSLVVFAGIGDRLDIAPAKTLRLSIGGPFAAGLSRGKANLVMQAARALRANAAGAPGASLRLTKRLPVAAGIGGGSADAAAALRGLNRLWGLVRSDRELRELGAELGADVPVCLAARAGYLSGIGEGFEPAPALPPVWLVLVNPSIPLATRAVFEARRGEFTAPLPRFAAPADARALARHLSPGRNDLEPAAVALVPAIGEVLAVLKAAPGCLLARMSGSGATCFGLFAEAATAGAAAAQIAANRPDWWAVAAPVPPRGGGEDRVSAEA